VEYEISRGLPSHFLALLRSECSCFFGAKDELYRRASAGSPGPFPITVAVELANGGLSYIPNREAYPQGQYEVISARMGPGWDTSKNNSSGVILIRSVPVRQRVIVLQFLKNAPKISIQQISEKVVDVIDRALVDALHLLVRDSSQAIPGDLSIG
jgi:hypothetical protein